MLPARIHLQRDGAAIGMTQRRLEGFGQTLAQIVARLEAVDDEIDVVLFRFGELGQGVDLVDFAIDAQTGETLRAQLGEEFELLALAPGDDRREDHQPGLRRQRQHVIDHLRDGLRFERPLVFRAIGRAGAGEQQAQIIVNLGDGADRRTRIVAGRLLLDGNGRRQPLDGIDVRLVHHLQKLAGVGRKRFDITPPPLGVERIEGQRGFPRTGETGDDDHPVARQIEIDVLEVMRARAANADFLEFFHEGAGGEGESDSIRKKDRG